MTVFDYYAIHAPTPPAWFEAEAEPVPPPIALKCRHRVLLEECPDCMAYVKHGDLQTEIANRNWLYREVKWRFAWAAAMMEERQHHEDWFHVGNDDCGNDLYGTGATAGTDGKEGR